MKVYVVVIHDHPVGDDYSLGAFTSKEKAENAIKSFLEEDGYKFQVEIQESICTTRWIYYYDCIYNPNCPSDLDLHYTADIDEYELE